MMLQRYNTVSNTNVEEPINPTHPTLLQSSGSAVAPPPRPPRFAPHSGPAPRARSFERFWPDASALSAAGSCLAEPRGPVAQPPLPAAHCAPTWCDRTWPCCSSDLPRTCGLQSLLLPRRQSRDRSGSARHVALRRMTARYQTATRGRRRSFRTMIASIVSGGNYTAGYSGQARGASRIWTACLRTTGHASA